jgi:hypothetical protein
LLQSRPEQEHCSAQNEQPLQTDNNAQVAENFRAGLGCHTCFGWITFVLIVYHSLFFISLAFWPENKISANYYVTGALALVPLSLVITSGLDKNILGGKAKEPSKINVTENEKEPLKIKEPKFVYVNHIVMTILLAVLILVHINFQ